MVSKKATVVEECRGCSHLPVISYQPVWHRVDKSLLSVWRQTYGCLPSRRASTPVGQCLVIVTEAHACEQLGQDCAQKHGSQESNSRPSGHKSSTIIAIPPDNMKGLFLFLFLLFIFIFLFYFFIYFLFFFAFFVSIASHQCYYSNFFFIHLLSFVLYTWNDLSHRRPALMALTFPAAYHNRNVIFFS